MYWTCIVDTDICFLHRLKSCFTLPSPFLLLYFVIFFCQFPFLVIFVVNGHGKRTERERHGRQRLACETFHEWFQLQIISLGLSIRLVNPRTEPNQLHKMVGFRMLDFIINHKPNRCWFAPDFRRWANSANHQIRFLFAILCLLLFIKSPKKCISVSLIFLSLSMIVLFFLTKTFTDWTLSCSHFGFY